MDQQEGFEGDELVRVGGWLRQLELSRRQCHLCVPNHPATEPFKRELWRTTRALPEALALVKITGRGFQLPGEELGAAAAASERLAAQLIELGIVAIGLRPPIEWPDAITFVTLVAGFKDRPSEEDRSAT